jgi:glutamate racemase
VPATLFVALAEEGWTQGEVVVAAARRYLEPLFRDEAVAPDVLVLGCTHFPPLADAIRMVVGQQVHIVDSAATTAEALADLLRADNLASGETRGVCQFLVTDGEERFARVGPTFLGRNISPAEVERINL